MIPRSALLVDPAASRADRAEALADPRVTDLLLGLGELYAYGGGSPADGILVEFPAPPVSTCTIFPL